MDPRAYRLSVRGRRGSSGSEPTALPGSLEFDDLRLAARSRSSMPRRPSARALLRLLPVLALGLALACTSLHAIHRSEIRIGDECAVIGMGVLGLTMISCLYAAGAGSITAISRSEAKRDRAKGFGATDGLSTLDLLKPDFKTPIQLSDVVFECTGKNPGLSVALSAADKQGKIIAAGFYTEPMALDGEAIFAKELTVYGVRASGPAGARGEFLRWPRGENLRLAVEYLKRGYIRTQEMITHRVKPEQLGDIYDMVENDSDPYILAVLEW